MALEVRGDHVLEWDSPLYRQALGQFDRVAELINLDANIRERLRTPQRALVVTFPSGVTTTSTSTPYTATGCSIC